MTFLIVVLFFHDRVRAMPAKWRDESLWRRSSVVSRRTQG